MSVQVTHRRGTSAQHGSFTGAEGEFTYDSTLKTIRVHDAETEGGIPLARKDEAEILLDDVAALLADTTLTYTAGSPSSVAAGKYVRTRAEGFAYEVAASGASDQHVTTVGGVKLLAIGTQDGSFNRQMFDGPVPLTMINRGIRTDNLKSLGAKGDGSDATQEFIDLAAYCRSSGSVMRVDSGKYTISDAPPQGVAFGVKGEATRCSELILDFSTEKWLLDFSTGLAGQPVSNLLIRGSTPFGGNEKFLNISDGRTSRLRDNILVDLKAGIRLGDSWGSYVENTFVVFCESPLYMEKANGCAITGFYSNNVKGNAIEIDEGITPILKNIVCERGVALDGGSGGISIVLRATRSASILGYYGELNSGAEIALSSRNQKAACNTYINGLWLQRGALASGYQEGGDATKRMIWALSYKGLTIENVEMNGCRAPYLIDNSDTSYSAGPIRVGVVTQINQNANGFIGDRREFPTEPTDSLVPIAADNREVIMTNWQPQVGDGTDSDTTNIANHTARDANGYRARLTVPPSVSQASVAGGLTCTSSSSTAVFGSESSGITMSSDTWCDAEINILGTVSSSSGAALFGKLRLTNVTTGEAISTAQISLGASGAALDRKVRIGLRPGRNTITMAITREQGGGGSNTATVTDFLVK